MLPYFTEIYGNASSNHSYGAKAKQAIDTAREFVADIINANSKEIVFTSGATEAINLGIKGYAEANLEKGNHIITVKTEHKAVLATCDYLETKGYEVTYLGVDENGLISLSELEEAITDDTILIAVMYVNNEVGVIQPIREIGEISKKHNIAFFCDATQAVGKVSVDVLKDSIDMLSLSGHKMNGPKGIGALFVRQGIDLTPQIHGGGQEGGLRAGTYNTPLIVGLGEACRLAQLEFESNVQKLLEVRAYWQREFEGNDLGKVLFKEVQRAPHILSISIHNMDAEDFLMAKSKEFAASTGSACNAEIIEASHVFMTIHGKESTNRGNLRVSIGLSTTQKQLHSLIDSIRDYMKKCNA